MKEAIARVCNDSYPGMDKGVSVEQMNVPLETLQEQSRSITSKITTLEQLVGSGNATTQRIKEEDAECAQS